MTTQSEQIISDEKINNLNNTHDNNLNIINNQQNDRNLNDNIGIDDINITTECKQVISDEKINNLDDNANINLDVTDTNKEFVNDNKVDYMSQDDSELEELDLENSQTYGAGMNIQRKISSTNLLFFILYLIQISVFVFYTNIYRYSYILYIYIYKNI